MSRQAFASRMRTSIDKIIKRHGDEAALQRLKEFGRNNGEAWLKRQDEIQNLRKAEEDLRSAAERMGNIRNELAAGHAQSRTSKTVKPPFKEKKRKLDEVEERVERVAELCKRMKREE